MRYLLDRDILCEMTRPRPDARVAAWVAKHAFTSYISSLTMGELWKGIQLISDEAKRRQFIRWYEEREESIAEHLILPDQAVLQTWGTYCVEQLRNGTHPPVIESLLAATALTHRLCIATRNQENFPGVDTVNPWTA